MVDIASDDLPLLEERLGSGKKFEFAAGMDLLEGLPDPVPQREAEVTAALLDIARDNRSKYVLLTFCKENDLAKRLLQLSRQARTALEEGGANILYLAIGFLAWMDGPTERHAPLVLVPVNLSRGTAGSRFRVEASSDETRFNITLIEKLRTEHSIGSLDLFATDLPRRGKGLDVESMLHDTAEAVKTLQGWKVTGRVALGLFSFSKHLMWKDLTDLENSGRDSSSEVLNLLINGVQLPKPARAPLEPEDLDGALDPADEFLPLRADSSQLAAVMRSASGGSFVLIGPPGTGKSQTIANIVAQSVALGKSVLFVAEKAAALNVVHRRLQALGLGGFCLELHSNRTDKLSIVRRLHAEAFSSAVNPWSGWRNASAWLAKARAFLNAYASAVHLARPSDVTPFSALGGLLACRESPDVVLDGPLTGRGALAMARDGLEALLDTADKLGGLSRECVSTGSVMDYLGPVVWTPEWEAGLCASAARLQGLGDRLRPFGEDLGPLAVPGLAATPLKLAGKLLALAGFLPVTFGGRLAFVKDGPASPERARLAEAVRLASDASAIASAFSGTCGSGAGGLPALLDDLARLAPDILAHAGLDVGWLDRPSLDYCVSGVREHPVLMRIAWKLSDPGGRGLPGTADPAGAVVAEVPMALDLLRDFAAALESLECSYEVDKALALDHAALRSSWDSESDAFFEGSGSSRCRGIESLARCLNPDRWTPEWEERLLASAARLQELRDRLRPFESGLGPLADPGLAAAPVMLAGKLFDLAGYLPVTFGGAFAFVKDGPDSPERARLAEAVRLSSDSAGLAFAFAGNCGSGTWRLPELLDSLAPLATDVLSRAGLDLGSLDRPSLDFCMAEAAERPDLMQPAWELSRVTPSGGPERPWPEDLPEPAEAVAGEVPQALELLRDYADAAGSLEGDYDLEKALSLDHVALKELLDPESDAFFAGSRVPRSRGIESLAGYLSPAGWSAEWAEGLFASVERLLGLRDRLGPFERELGPLADPGLSATPLNLAGTLLALAVHLPATRGGAFAFVAAGPAAPEREKLAEALRLSAEAADIASAFFGHGLGGAGRLPAVLDSLAPLAPDILFLAGMDIGSLDRQSLDFCAREADERPSLMRLAWKISCADASETGRPAVSAVQVTAELPRALELLGDCAAAVKSLQGTYDLEKALAMDHASLRALWDKESDSFFVGDRNRERPGTGSLARYLSPAVWTQEWAEGLCRSAAGLLGFRDKLRPFEGELGPPETPGLAATPLKFAGKLFALARYLPVIRNGSFAFVKDGHASPEWARLTEAAGRSAEAAALASAFAGDCGGGEGRLPSVLDALAPLAPDILARAGLDLGSLDRGSIEYCVSEAGKRPELMRPAWELSSAGVSWVAGVAGVSGIAGPDCPEEPADAVASEVPRALELLGVCENALKSVEGPYDLEKALALDHAALKELWDPESDTFFGGKDNLGPDGMALLARYLNPTAWTSEWEEELRSSAVRLSGIRDRLRPFDKDLGPLADPGLAGTPLKFARNLLSLAGYLPVTFGGGFAFVNAGPASPERARLAEAARLSSDAAAIAAAFAGDRGGGSVRLPAVLDALAPLAPDILARTGLELGSLDRESIDFCVREADERPDLMRPAWELSGKGVAAGSGAAGLGDPAGSAVLEVPRALDLLRDFASALKSLEGDYEPEKALALDHAALRSLWEPASDAFLAGAGAGAGDGGSAAYGLLARYLSPAGWTPEREEELRSSAARLLEIRDRLIPFEEELGPLADPGLAGTPLKLAGKFFALAGYLPVTRGGGFAFLKGGSGAPYRARLAEAARLSSDASAIASSFAGDGCGGAERLPSVLDALAPLAPDILAHAEVDFATLDRSSIEFCISEAEARPDLMRPAWELSVDEFSGADGLTVPAGSVIAEVPRALDLLRDCSAALGSLEGNYDVGKVFALDHVGLKALWDSSDGAFFVSAVLRRRKVRRSLAETMKSPGALKLSDPGAELERLSAAAVASRALDALPHLAEVRRMPGGRAAFNGRATEPASLSRFRDILVRLKTAGPAMRHAAKVFSDIQSGIVHALENADSLSAILKGRTSWGRWGQSMSGAVDAMLEGKVPDGTESWSGSPGMPGAKGAPGVAGVTGRTCVAWPAGGQDGFQLWQERVGEAARDTDSFGEEAAGMLRIMGWNGDASDLEFSRLAGLASEAVNCIRGIVRCRKVRKALAGAMKTPGDFSLSDPGAELDRLSVAAGAAGALDALPSLSAVRLMKGGVAAFDGRDTDPAALSRFRDILERLKTARPAMKNVADSLSAAASVIRSALVTADALSSVLRGRSSWGRWGQSMAGSVCAMLEGKIPCGGTGGTCATVTPDVAEVSGLPGSHGTPGEPGRAVPALHEGASDGNRVWKDRVAEASRNTDAFRAEATGMLRLMGWKGDAQELDFSELDGLAGAVTNFLPGIVRCMRVRNVLDQAMMSPGSFRISDTGGDLDRLSAVACAARELDALPYLAAVRNISGGRAAFDGRATDPEELSRFRDILLRLKTARPAMASAAQSLCHIASKMKLTRETADALQAIVGDRESWGPSGESFGKVADAMLEGTPPYNRSDESGLSEVPDMTGLSQATVLSEAAVACDGTRLFQELLAEASRNVDSFKSESVNMLRHMGWTGDVLELNFSDLDSIAEDIVKFLPGVVRCRMVRTNLLEAMTAADSPCLSETGADPERPSDPVSDISFLADPGAELDSLGALARASRELDALPALSAVRIMPDGREAFDGNATDTSELMRFGDILARLQTALPATRAALETLSEAVSRIKTAIDTADAIYAILDERPSWGAWGQRMDDAVDAMLKGKTRRSGESWLAHEGLAAGSQESVVARRSDGDVDGYSSWRQRVTEATQNTCSFRAEAAHMLRLMGWKGDVDELDFSLLAGLAEDVARSLSGILRCREVRRTLAETLKVSSRFSLSESGSELACSSDTASDQDRPSDTIADLEGLSDPGADLERLSAAALASESLDALPALAAVRRGPGGSPAFDGRGTDPASLSRFRDMLERLKTARPAMEKTAENLSGASARIQSVLDTADALSALLSDMPSWGAWGERMARAAEAMLDGKTPYGGAGQSCSPGVTGEAVPASCPPASTDGEGGNGANCDVGNGTWKCLVDIASRNADAFQAEADDMFRLMGCELEAREFSFSHLEEIAGDVANFLPGIVRCHNVRRTLEEVMTEPESFRLSHPGAELAGLSAAALASDALDALPSLSAVRLMPGGSKTIFDGRNTVPSTLSQFHDMLVRLKIARPAMENAAKYLSGAVSRIQFSLDAADSLSTLLDERATWGSWGKSLNSAVDAMLEGRIPYGRSGESVTAAGHPGDTDEQITAEAPGGDDFSRPWKERIEEASRDVEDFLLEAANLLGIMGWKGDVQNLDFVNVEEVASDVLMYRDKLNACITYMALCKEAAPSGLGPFTDSLKKGDVPEGWERATVWKSFCSHFMCQAVSDDSQVLGATSAVRIHQLELFRKHFETKLAGTVGHVKGMLRSSRILGRLPVDEVKLLERENIKKRKHLPVRRLLASLPQSVRALTPCLLMSPQSVAQYLPADCAPFDLVVFDEASQIPSADAVGALARGRMAVVVGDPKQLPPTDFFTKKVGGGGGDDEEEEGDEEPMESILDDFLAAAFPKVELAWHYRSRSESLISFSNVHYYGGNLVTFPSPDASGRAVSFEKVDGVYDRGRGGSRTNVVEAEAVAADVLALLRSPESAREGFSVGVVTFNATQQELIENILERERLKDPSLEQFFDESHDEPLIVKNLENIQGDERGYVFFSVCYGPDQTGKMYLNFGPLNKIGGERRLNVAITRARLGVKVFASFTPDVIPDTVASQGVAGLRDFMRYAMLGGVGASSRTGDVNDGGSAPADFVGFVADGLKARGWDVDVSLGDSRFRMDIAVKDPADPSRYLAGIECDGESYRDAATAVDREILRGEVLAGLGWTIIRIWSMDWWKQSGTGVADAKLDALDHRLKTLRAIKACP
jgi:hypothetical protein